MVEQTEGPQATEAELNEMIAATDTGARNPAGNVGKLLLLMAFLWSVFQLWIASPLPYMDMFSSWLPVLNNTDTRSIHLAFAVSLAFLAYPALKSSPRDSIPIQDWVMAIGGIVVTMYLSVFAEELGERSGLPTTTDLVMAGIGVALVLEAARRALGPPLMIIAMIFLCYVFFGHLGPEIIAWKGASFGKAMSHMWLTQEGVLVSRWVYRLLWSSCLFYLVQCWKKQAPVTTLSGLRFLCWGICVAGQQKLLWFLLH